MDQAKPEKKIKKIPTMDDAHNAIAKAHGQLIAALSIIKDTPEVKKKILYQHLLMGIGFIEGIVENFDKYSSTPQEENQITKNNISEDDVIRYIKEENVNGIEKFPDQWVKDGRD